jgi:hypothetical protein
MIGGVTYLNKVPRDCTIPTAYIHLIRERERPALVIGKPDLYERRKGVK